MVEWLVDQKVGAVQQQYQTQQQIAQAQALRIQAVQQVIQNNGVDRQTGENFYQIIEAVAQGKPVTGLNVIDALYKGMYHDKIVEAKVNKRIELYLAGNNGNMSIPSTTLAPGADNAGQLKHEVGWEEDVFGNTPRN